MTADAQYLPESEITVAGTALLAPRTTLGPAANTVWTMVWLISGRGTVTSGGRTWPLVPGTVHLSPPNTVGYWEWDPESTIREGSITFRSEGSPTWPRNRRFEPHHVVPGLLTHIMWLSSERPDGWEQAREEAFRYALRAFVNGYFGSDPADFVPLPVPMARAVAFVQRAWDVPPIAVHSLDELATAAGVTKSHLCRLFELETGTGPVGAFRMLRLERAATLLEQTDLSVTTIARHAGFPNEFHFSRVFRTVSGLSPRAFRADPHARFELPPRLKQLASRMWREYLADRAPTG